MFIAIYEKHTYSFLGSYMYVCICIYVCICMHVLSAHVCICEKFRFWRIYWITAILKIIDVRYQLSMVFSTSLLLENRWNHDNGRQLLWEWQYVNGFHLHVGLVRWVWSLYWIFVALRIRFLVISTDLIFILDYCWILRICYWIISSLYWAIVGFRILYIGLFRWIIWFFLHFFNRYSPLLDYFNGFNIFIGLFRWFFFVCLYANKLLKLLIAHWGWRRPSWTWTKLDAGPSLFLTIQINWPWPCVFMCVCMYVCMYVCMCVCTYTMTVTVQPVYECFQMSNQAAALWLSR